VAAMARKRNCKDVRAFPMPSGPKLKPILSEETLALISEDARSWSQLAVIGVVPTRQPSRVEVQSWVDLHLHCSSDWKEPAVGVTRIRMLKRGYFVLTFASAERALETLKGSPFEFGTHRLYLHPWKPQFDPEKPMSGIRIPIWIRFPHLDDIYFRALPSLCAEIGEVVWTGEREDYLKKSSTPRICVLVEDLRTLPSALILPIPDTNEEVEIELEYEDVPSQCSNCLGLGHKHTACELAHPDDKRINSPGFNSKQSRSHPKLLECVRASFDGDSGPEWYPNEIFCSTPHKCLAPPALHFKNHFSGPK
jgi:hypothetical protein